MNNRVTCRAWVLLAGLWSGTALAQVPMGAGTYSQDFDALAGNGAIELTEAEIRERMSGNLCRCGAYANIVPAIADASS